MRKSKFALFTLVSILTFSLATNVYAQEALQRLNNLSTGGQSEYKNSNRQNRLLIEVNMLSGVQQKGIHQVPDNTNLIDMVSLAGGPEPQVDLTEVHVKRRTDKGFVTLSYDLEEMISDKRVGYPTLAEGDVIMIERTNMDHIYTTIALVAGVLGIVVSGFLIRNELKKN